MNIILKHIYIYESYLPWYLIKIPIREKAQRVIVLVELIMLVIEIRILSVYCKKLFCTFQKIKWLK